MKKIYRYDIRAKAILKTLNKYYMTDLGIAQIKNNNFEINKSFAIENVVYNELQIRGYDVYIGKTKEREFGAYKEINDNYPKYVLSLDKANFSRNGIIHKNIINWLLEK